MTLLCETRSPRVSKLPVMLADVSSQLRQIVPAAALALFALVISPQTAVYDHPRLLQTMLKRRHS